MILLLILVPDCNPCRRDNSNVTSIWFTFPNFPFEITTVHLNIIYNLLSTIKMPFNMIESLITVIPSLLLQQHNLFTKSASIVTLAILTNSLLTNLLINCIFINRVYRLKMCDIDIMKIEESCLNLFIMPLLLESQQALKKFHLIYDLINKKKL